MNGITAVRVYYEDTDFSGNVYHAAYLKFMERGRTELLRGLGIHHAELAEQGIAFAVSAMAIQFLKPARIDDVLAVETRVVTTSGVRLVLEQGVLRDGVPLVTARVTVASIRMAGGVARLPRDVLARLKPS